MEQSLLVYKASAGSGKTYTLAARYIALVLGNETHAFRNILAVTFTNKATGEMKERILQRLYDLQAGQDADFLKTMKALLPNLSEAEITKRASLALLAIVHDYDHFRVETIDSFFQSLLTNLARELSLPANFKVNLEDKEVIAAAVDRLLQEIDTNKEILLWVLDYIGEEIEENKKWDISGELKRFGANLLNGEYLKYEEGLRNVLNSNERLSEYRATLIKLENSVVKDAVNAASTLRDQICAYEGFEVKGARTLFTYLGRIELEDFMTAPTATVLGLTENPENWLKKNDLKKGGFIEVCSDWCESLQWIEAKRKHAAQIVSSCRISRRYINQLRLLNEIARKMNEINRENNRFMLAKTPQLFNNLVHGEDASFVFEKAGTLFQHIMIDEFQDTSHMQWDNFKKLLIENTSTGNRCLLVGDVKQSIYRWRGGDWNILQNIKGEFHDGMVKVENLDTNFRSANNIVDFNNQFFRAAANALDHLTIEKGDSLPFVSIAEIYEDVEQKKKKDATEGFVKVCLSNKDDHTEEDAMDCLANEILNLHAQHIPFNKMGILVRYNSTAAKLLNYFAANHPGIPLASDEAFLLKSSPAVRMIVNALRYLIDPQNAIARTALVRSYYTLVLHRDIKWEEITRNGENLLPIGFTMEREKMLSMPLFELCERLIQTFSLERTRLNSEKDETQGQAAYLFCFMDHVLGFLDENPSDLPLFLAYWDETLARKPIPAQEVDSVRITTIHKSKGLAFHTVFIPFCDWQLERDMLGDILWCTPQEAPYNELPLVPVNTYSSKMVRESIYAPEYRKEHLQRRIDNLNTLYVAFTRAQYNLIVFAGYTAPKVKKKDEPTTQPLNSIGDLLKTCITIEGMTCENDITTNTEVWHMGQPDNGKKKETQKATVSSRNPLEYEAERASVSLCVLDYKPEFRQSNKAKDFISEKDTGFIERGKILHELFSAIRTKEDLPAALNDLKSHGFIANEKEFNIIRSTATKALETPEISEWFDGSWLLYNECNILVRNEKGIVHPRRPDRVMVKAGKTVVVDFKFGNPHDKYNEQVKDYIRLLNTMGHSNVKGYLWYIHKNYNVVEEVAP